MYTNRSVVIFRHIFDLVGPRVGSLYLIVFLIFFFFIGDQFKVQSDMQALNRIMPQFEPLADFMEKGNPIDEDTLDDQVLYFKSVLQYMTGFSAAHEMLGLSYFYQGKVDQAEESFHKAVESNPETFWFYYNQGVFYYKKKDFAKSVESFQKALRCDPKKTIQFMAFSKIYLPIFMASKLDLNNELIKRLQEGYSWAYRFIIDSYLRQRDYQNVLNVAVIGIQSGLDRKGIYHYYAGMAAYHLKDFKTAVYYLQESIKKNPDYSETFYYLGLSVQAAGKEDMARSFFERAKNLKTPQDVLQEDLNKKELQIY